MKAAWLALVVVAAAACGTDPDETGEASSISEPAPTAALVTEAELDPEFEAPEDEEPLPDDEAPDDEEPAPDETPPPDEVAAAGGIDPNATRDDIDCSPDGLGSTDETTFTVAHYVVDGSLGAACLGEDDQTLIDSWMLLAAITPPLQLTDLGVFGGFESGESGDEETLAFVNALDEEHTQFQMSVNLSVAAADPDELALTMAHEFSHVFASTATQVDYSAEARETCTTHWNGEGCYLPDSLMWAWIETFWGDGLIDEIDPDSEATAAGGQARCDADPGFFGPYAASIPEEDFAESFSAFVFALEAATPGQQARLDWIAQQPGLAEFRERAEAVGLTPLANRFELCGL